MSIPGLGQFTPQPTASTTRTITLRPFWEWRFSVPRSSRSSGNSSSTSTGTLSIRLLSGTAERDGTELALNHSYTFSRAKSKILTYTGCTIEVTGDYGIGGDGSGLTQYPSPEASPALAHLNLHFALQAQRTAAAQQQQQRQQQQQQPSQQQSQQHNGGATTTTASAKPGPRIMICGPQDSGKTTLARTLTALATRVGAQPLAANIDPREGLLALPGTVSAAVFGTVMDAEDPQGGFGVASTPSSGPSVVPVKLPMVYYFGRERVGEDAGLWRDLVVKLGSSVRAKFAADQSVRAAGLVLDTPAVAEGEEMGDGVEGLVHAVREFAVNIVVVIGSAAIHTELQRRLEKEKTAHGESITLLLLDKSDGVQQRDAEFMKAVQEGAIKEYFFGDSKRTLSPFTQSVSFDDVAIFKTPDDADLYDNAQGLEPAEISAEMSHWTLAVMNASVNDPPETIRQAPVMGFVAVADVDEDRRRLKILSPVSGRLGNQPLVWGRWPEPYINLLG